MITPIWNCSNDYHWSEFNITQLNWIDKCSHTVLIQNLRRFSAGESHSTDILVEMYCLLKRISHTGRLLKILINFYPHLINIFTVVVNAFGFLFLLKQKINKHCHRKSRDIFPTGTIHFAVQLERFKYLAVFAK